MTTEPGRTAYEARFAGEKQGPRGTVDPWEMLPDSTRAIWRRVEDAVTTRPATQPDAGEAPRAALLHGLLFEVAQHFVFDPEGDLTGEEFDALGKRILDAIAVPPATPAQGPVGGVSVSVEEIAELQRLSDDASPGIAWADGDNYRLMVAPNGSTFINEQRVVALCATGDRALANAAFLAGLWNAFRSGSLTRLTAPGGGGTDPNSLARAIAAKAAEIAPIFLDIKRPTRGLYVASKTSHAPRWRDLRAAGVPIISTWIDEAGKGETACFADLWQRCVDEACNARAVIVYREPGEVLKGAFVEVGAALASGVPVYAVGCDEFSFVHHAGVTRCASFDEALDMASVEVPPSAEPAKPSTPGVTPDRKLAIARENAERVCHEEQMTVWTGEIAGRLSMGGYLRDNLSYGGALSLRSDMADEIRSIVESAFSHPELEALTPSDGQVGVPVERVRHQNGRSEYDVLHRGVCVRIGKSRRDYTPSYVLIEGDRLVIYRGDDGKLHAREEGEFDDGRFEPLSARPTATEG